MNIDFLLTVSSFNNIQCFFLFNSISISPLRLHSASSVQIPSSTRQLNTMLPSIKKRPLNILSASSINLHGIANRNVFHSILGLDCLVYNYQFFVNTLIRSKRYGMYPSISKGNAKRCKCCKHSSTKSTVTSSVFSNQ